MQVIRHDTCIGQSFAQIALRLERIVDPSKQHRLIEQNRTRAAKTLANLDQRTIDLTRMVHMQNDPHRFAPWTERNRLEAFKKIRIDPAWNHHRKSGVDSDSRNMR